LEKREMQGKLRLMMRTSLMWSLLLISSLLLMGCMETVLGVLLAPEMVIAESANQAAQAGAQSLTTMGVDQIADTGQAIADLSRIIRDNPDAANIEQLIVTRDRIAQGSNVGNKKTRGGARGDRIMLPPPRTPMPNLRSAQGCPDLLPDGGAISASREEPWMIATDPVRLQ
jgi:hypothetical protein